METKIRNATLSDIPSILHFAKYVGRYISADEVRTFLQIDPLAMFLAETYPGGKLIGSCCGTRLTPELGYMGLYVVLEEYRGKGIGLKLWKAAKEHLGDRNIGVRGDPINFKKYTEKDGFSHVEDYSIVYYECFGDSLPTNIISSSDIEVATYFEGNLIGFNKKLSNDNHSSTKKPKPHKESRKIESDAGNFGSKEICTEGNIMKNMEDPGKSSLAIDHLITDGSSDGELVGKSSLAVDHLITDGSPDGKLVGKSRPLKANVGDMSIQSALEGLSSTENEDKQLMQICNDFSFNSMNLNVVKNSKAEDILSGVVSFDKLLNKRDRSLIVRQTFSWSSCRSKVALLGCKVVGYACLRNVVTENWLISPFYADTERVAETLLFELLREFDFSQAPKGIQIRFPDKNIACKRLAEKFGFRGRSTRILTGFKKQCINIETSKVYSFHSTVFSSE